MEEYGIDLSARYTDLKLRTPIVLAPGQLSRFTSQIERAARAGYGAIVLKSVVGEDRDGNASVKFLRRKPTFMRWYIDKRLDPEGRNPTIHWNGGFDTRNLKEHLRFAKEAYEFGRRVEIPIIASILCHLVSSSEEEFKVEEWEYTTKMLCEIGYRHFEVDFTPFLKGEDKISDKETVLRWYREVPKIMREGPYEIKIVPKIMNLDFGIDYQVEMVKAAKEGGCDGVTIANRFFRWFKDETTGEEYSSPHGGAELRMINQEQIREVRRRGIEIPINATGGVYTGSDVAEYLSLGAQNVQVLTYVLKKGFENAINNLLFNPEEGLIHYLKLARNG